MRLNRKLKMKNNMLTLKQYRYNKQYIGYLLGLICPILTLLVLYLSLYSGENLQSFFYDFWANRQISRLLAISVLPNLVVFFIFIWTNRLRSAQGVLGSTIILAIIVMTIRFII